MAIETRLDRMSVPARDMHEALAAAAVSGKLEYVLDPYDWNELRPDFGNGPPEDPMAAIRLQSIDGTGIDVLAQMANALSMPFAIVPLGKDIENNRMFVFPYLAAINLRQATLAQRVDVFRIAGSVAGARMLKTGRYDGLSLTIGNDGNWHRLSFAAPLDDARSGPKPEAR